MKNFIVYALIGVGVVAYNVATDADRDETGAIVGEGTIDAFSVQLGDCFNEVSSLASDEPGDVSSLPGVPCSDPHDYEVFAVFDVSQTEFPGAEAMSNIALDACVERFDAFVGRDYESSELDVTSLYPSPESWSAQNDREVVCAVYDMNGNQLTGTAKGSAM